MTDPFPFRRYVTPASCRPLTGSPHHPHVFAMQSFPSGHTATSFFVGTFLALYLNAKLKAFSDYHTSLWKWVAVMYPLFGSCLIAGTLVVDRNHHVHDILLSMPLGVLVAFLAYRSHYASVFDYRTNHLPLPWSGTRQSLHPTVPEPETRGGDNITAVRKRVEHQFDGRWDGSAGLGLDGAVERLRGPREISRGRLRENIFPWPRPTAVAVDEGGIELSNLGDGDADDEEEGEDDVAAGPSTARSTGRQVDLEGQRQRRWTTEAGGDVE